MSRKGIRFNTGRTHFKKGFTPWNKGMKMVMTDKMAEANNRKKGISMPKPEGFSETMRLVNPPLGKKKKFSSRDGYKKLKVWRDGYVFLYRPDHPSSRKVPPDYGYILEHRMVVEDYLGRPLLKSEFIHHIDGCKSNNKLSNLLLCENSKKHNRVHELMEIFVEGLIREGKVIYDTEKEEFRFR